MRATSIWPTLTAIGLAYAAGLFLLQLAAARAAQGAEVSRPPSPARAGQLNSPDESVRGRLWIIEPAPRRPKPATLRIVASPVNWDADVAYDGIELRVLPLTASMEVAPLDGHLLVKLTARKYSTRTARESPLVEVGTWSQHVRAADFGPNGALYHLPFRSYHPDRDLSLSAYGHLSARLDAFRSGRLRAAQSVRVRVAGGS